jgi:asparagine synthase (glutamine-hydrolysing)
MCGIAGFVAPRGREGISELRAMLTRLSHRGPDGEGVWRSEDRKVGFGHKRLAIIDTSSQADQPMHTFDGTTSIVFNGEIYNHRELRVELEQAGRKFKTAGSDTEVLLHGYLAWGIDGLLRRLIGMYAFAIADTDRNVVHIVRDRVGVKPISLLRMNGIIFFASEIKAFMELPGFKAKLDEENFFHHLSFRSLPAPRSLFKGITKLRPGHLLSISLDTGAETDRSYWSPLSETIQSNVSRQQAASEIAVLLEDSIAYRMVSDVPIGVFLSGGVDSNYVLSHMFERTSDIASFTAVYPGFPEFSEGKIAGEFASKFGTAHEEVSVTQESFIELLPEIAYYQDEPISAPICVPVFLLSRAARNSHTKVVLTGEGSDELFVGYESWARILRLERRLRPFPNVAKSVLGKVCALALAGVVGPESRSLEFLHRLGGGRPLFWGGAMDFTEAEKLDLVAPHIAARGYDTYEAVIEPIRKDFLSLRGADDVTAWMSFLDLRFRLPELMLSRVDKMGMANSIEGRVPFLDHRLIEYYLSLPRALREDSSLEGKGLFKGIAARRLGHDFVHSRKRGFQAPIQQWKTDRFGQHFNPMLAEFARKTGLFRKDALAALIERPNDRLYFSLINFVLWYNVFIEKVIPDASLS